MTFHYPLAIEKWAKSLVESYRKTEKITNIEKKRFPSRAKVIEITEELRELLFPGYLGPTNWCWLNAEYLVGDKLDYMFGELSWEIAFSLDNVFSE